MMNESDLPIPIDDSITHETHHQEEEDEHPRHQQYQQQPYYYPPQPQVVYAEQPQKNGDIFSKLDRIHWIIIIAVVLLAFFMGKSIATPIIIKSSV